MSTTSDALSRSPRSALALTKRTTPAAGAVLGRSWAERERPARANGPAAQPCARTLRRATPVRARHRGTQRRRIQGRRNRQQVSCHRSRSGGGGHGGRRESEGGEPDGDQVRDRSRGHGAEPGRRRQRVEGVISRAVRSPRDRGPNLHPICRARGVSSPRASTYAPSHT